jgi:hypothetical protein
VLVEPRLDAGLRREFSSHPCNPFLLAIRLRA